MAVDETASTYDYGMLTLILGWVAVSFAFVCSVPTLICGRRPLVDSKEDYYLYLPILCGLIVPLILIIAMIITSHSASALTRNYSTQIDLLEPMKTCVET